MKVLSNRVAESVAILATIAASVFIGRPATACLWDDDTLAAERAEFPGALEIITGKFPRHSEAFYRWRVENLTRDVEALSTYDNLAVAYDKLGRHDRAIDLMRDKALILNKRLGPARAKGSVDWMFDGGDGADGSHSGLASEVYQTLANLGTFHIHSGDYRRGLKFIHRALLVNPDAHFGRERYQQILVEYVLQRGADQLPLGASKGDPEASPFASFLAGRLAVHPCHAAAYLARYGYRAERSRRHDQILEIDIPALLKRRLESDRCSDLERGEANRLTLTKEQVREARKGILGMMRFGNFRSPILLEALGNLLYRFPTNDFWGSGVTSGEDDFGETLLAARAYLLASRRVDDPKATQKYRDFAEQVLSVRENRELSDIEKKLDNELREGREYFAKIERDERKFIASGDDPAKKFREKYLVPAKRPGPESTGAGQSGADPSPDSGNELAAADVSDTGSADRAEPDVQLPEADPHPRTGGSLWMLLIGAVGGGILVFVSQKLLG